MDRGRSEAPLRATLARVPALLASLKSQSAPLETLQRALKSGRVHHAYLFEGEDGVGKELAAFGLAQALECERRAEGSWQACGTCSACERVLPKNGVSRHPDVVVLERALYEPAQIGRKNPETAELSIDQVRTLVLARAAFPPHEGRAKVFIVRRAEELSISAANALLKTLEEPGARTHFVLVTTQPDALLPTILSRTLRVHFGSLSDRTIAEILSAHGVEGDVAKIASLAEGSASRALALANPEDLAERDAFVARATKAVDSPDAMLGLELAEDAKKEKDVLAPRLADLARHYADEAKARAGANDARAFRAAARSRLALTAVGELEQNGAAQLVVESMILKMRSA